MIFDGRLLYGVRILPSPGRSFSTEFIILALLWAHNLPLDVKRS
jgi:hypothetical protein